MYVKLFSSLYQGTLRGRTNEILVFTNLLAHADQFGVVDKHWKAIAEETGLTIEQVKEACEALEAPDEESRSPEEDGRRILKTDGHRGWGWRITNYGKYRAIRNEDDRREQNRLAQERWREKNKQARKQNKQSKPRSAQAEADTYTEESKTRAGRGSRLPHDWNPSEELEKWASVERPDLYLPREVDSFRDYWTGIAGAKGVKLDWPAAFRNWIRRANGFTGSREAPRAAPSKARQKLNLLQDYRNGLDTERNSSRLPKADRSCR